MAMPTSIFIRVIFLNDLHHYRSQPGVCLGLFDTKVPSSYGPRGDELPKVMSQSQVSGH